MSSERGYVPPEARDERIGPAVEFTNDEDLVSFWRAFYKNDGWNFATPEAEELAAKKAAQTPAKNPSRFFGIRDGDAIIATGKLEIQIKDGEKHGYLA